MQARSKNAAPDLAQIFKQSLAALGPFPSAPHLAIALSGGADSMALALLASEWADTHGGRITTLTVDHGLRAESPQEATQVAAWMESRNIPHHILTPPHADHSGNFQENARYRRYDALAEWCRAHDVLHCLLAHHAGDQRETVALMTERGDTADGASGMAAVRNYQGIRFLRPLINLEKEMLQHFLQQNNVPWVEDPSNRNTGFARVRQRQKLADNPATQTALTHQQQAAAQSRIARDQALAGAAIQCVTLHPLGYADLEKSHFLQLPSGVATQLLADLLTTISSETTRPRGHETQRLFETLQTPFTRTTLQRCEITDHKTTLRIAREPSRCAPPVTLTGTGTLRWDNRFHIYYHLPEPLTLQALGRNRLGLPEATPSFRHLDEWHFIPHMEGTVLPEGARVEVGFAPAKPLASAPFWCLN